VFSRSNNVETRTDLPLSGFSMPSATGEQGEAYDRVVIDFVRPQPPLKAP
jgi:hypothetical protein